MRTARVMVVPYDAAWALAFEAIAKDIKQALGDLMLGVEHVGSTAVPGLWAKPCIDLDVIIQDYSVLDAVCERLAAIGYEHEGNLGIPGREAFRYTNKPHLQTHHLYVCPVGSLELRRHIAFRDFLRSHPEAVEKYSSVKRTAAALFPEDIDQYIQYKSPCIEEFYHRIFDGAENGCLESSICER